MISIQEIRFKIHCDVCNKLYIDKNYKNHLKSQEQINNFIKKKQKITGVILSKIK